MSLRILVTGSRSWVDQTVIRLALLDVLRRHPGPTWPPVLIHGAARGADTIAADEWTHLSTDYRGGLATEVYPAAQFSSPLVRNEYMVGLGAVVCLAFAHRWASGTGHCARAARRAGIPVRDYGVPTGAGERP